MKNVPGFIGVFPHDIVPTLKFSGKKFQCLVMNLDSSGNPGTHWVAFACIPDKKVCVYFDTFAVPPDDRSMKFLKTGKFHIFCNHRQIQEDSSVECGYFCVAFLKLLAKGLSPDEAIDQFIPHPSDVNELLAIKDTEIGGGPFMDWVSGLTGRRPGEKDIKKLIVEHGNASITGILVCRDEVQAYVQKLLDLISAGKFSEAKQMYSYDKLFHLYAIITLSDGYRFQTEKNPYPTVRAVQKNSTDGFIAVPITKTITVKDFFNRAMTSQGKNFFDYQPFLNNCQHYIDSLISANGLMTPAVKTFTQQGVEKLAKELPDSTGKISQFITDLAGTWQMVKGSGIANPGKKRGDVMKGGNLDFIMPDISVLKAKLSGEPLSSVATCLINASANYYGNKSGPEKDQWVSRFQGYRGIPPPTNYPDAVIPDLSWVNVIASGDQLASLKNLLANNAEKTIEFRASDDIDSPMTSADFNTINSRYSQY
jgi:hypothetical protein